MNRQFIIIILFLFTGIFISCGKGKELSISERYPAPWIEDFNKDLTIALTQSKVTDCGQYKYRKSSIDKNEYLVYCTKDGKKWNSYIVWVGTNKVMGPHEPDPELK